MKCAVLGDPIAHSLSPVLHRAAYDETGLDWTYDAVRVPAGSLAASSRPGRGLARALADDAAEARGDAAGRRRLARGPRWWARRTRWSWSTARCTPTTPTCRVRRPRSASGTTARSPPPRCWARAPPPPRWGSRSATSARARCCCWPATRRGPRRRWPPSSGTPTAPGRGGLAGGRTRRPARCSSPRSRRRPRTPTWWPAARSRPVVFDVVYDPWPTPLAGRAPRPGAGQRARPARAPGGAAVLDSSPDCPRRWSGCAPPASGRWQ